MSSSSLGKVLNVVVLLGFIGFIIKWVHQFDVHKPSRPVLLFYKIQYSDHAIYKYHCLFRKTTNIGTHFLS